MTDPARQLVRTIAESQQQPCFHGRCDSEAGMNATEIRRGVPVPSKPRKTERAVQCLRGAGFVSGEFLLSLPEFFARRAFWISAIRRS